MSKSTQSSPLTTPQVPGPDPDSLETDFDIRRANYALRRAELARRAANTSSRDTWDKASVLSGFVSSVVIAAVGLAISYAIHQGQVHSTEEIANRTLSAENERQTKALEMERVQLTNQVLDAAASSSDARRALSVQLMFDVLPRLQFERLALIVARTDSSPEVRQHALRLLEQASGPDTLRELRQLANDRERNTTERMLASFSAQSIAVRAGLGPATFVFAASALDGAAFEDEEGGVFTRAALEAFRGNGDYSGDNTLDASELSEFVRHEVTRQFAIQRPISVFTGPANSIVDPESMTFRRVKAVVVGVSKYKTGTLFPLPGARKDAERVAAYLREAARDRLMITELYDEVATSREILQAIQKLGDNSDASTLLLVFFAGHGVESEGEPAWVAFDFLPSTQENQVTRGILTSHPVAAMPPTLRGTNLVFFREVKKALRNSKAKARLFLIDTCAASPLNSPAPEEVMIQIEHGSPVVR
jgi:hypothetical protein